jgi:hypothetical protein
MRYNEPDLNANCTNVQDTYIALRGSLKRVSQKQLRDALKRQKTEVMRGAALTTTFYVVPRRNFEGKGTPADVVDNLITDEQLAEFEVPGGTATDFTSVYIVDQNCPRSLLGRGVTQLVFQQKSQRRMTLPPAGAEDGGADMAETTVGASPHPPKAAVPAATPAAAPAGEPAEPRPATAQRGLARQWSAVPSDEEGVKRQEMSLEKVLEKMKEAVQAKRFYSTSLANTSTLHFWAAVAVGTETRGDASAWPMVQKFFPKFLTDILLDNACYAELPRFKHIFEKLEEHGGRMPKVSVLVRRLMDHDPLSDHLISFEGVSLPAHMRFHESVLNGDFSQVRIKSRLELARSTTEPARRREILTELADLPCADEVTSSHVKMAVSLFGMHVGAGERYAYVLGDASRVRFASSWGASEEYGCLTAFVEVPESWADITWASFKAGTDKIMEHQLKSHVKNPVALAILETMSTLSASCGTQGWMDALWVHMAAARCGAPMWVSGDDVPEVRPSDYERQHLSAVVKACSKLLGTGEFAFLVILRKAYQDQKALRASDATAAKEEDQKEPVPDTTPQGGSCRTNADAPEGKASVGAAEDGHIASVPAASQLPAAGGDAKQPTAGAIAGAAEVGDTVMLRFTARSDKFVYNGAQAHVEHVLAHDINVRIVDGDQGDKVKLSKTQATLVGKKRAQTNGAEEAPTGPAAEEAPTGPAADVVPTGPADGADMWQEAKNLFGSAAVEDEEE